jgi:outer membrane protein assembly factor BamB
MDTQKTAGSLLLVWLVFAGVGLADDGQARQILQTSGIKGGLVVHLGCGEGKLTAALRDGEAFLVHGIDADANNVEKARTYIRSLGLYGKVSAGRFDGRNLPYVDGLVNLLVAEDLGAVTMDEVMRVLAPGGVACLKHGQQWQKTAKPWPKDIDDWSHHLQGPDNNPVANDKVVASPRGLKWTCGPLWSRSHEFLSSLSAMVSAEGRLFYAFDEGLTGVTDKPIPDRWTLIARDAFNGVLLWKRPLANWGADAWRTRALRSTPRMVPYLMVAGGQRLFIVLDEAKGVSALDAATGKLLATYDGTAGATEIRHIDGVLLAVTGNDQLVAVDAAGGRPMWSAKGKIPPQTLAAQGDKVFCPIDGKLKCLTLADGKTLWQGDEELAAKRLSVHDNYILLALRGKIEARAADSGRLLWEQSGGASNGDLFIVGDRVYQPSGLTVGVRDLATGKEVARIDPSEVMTTGHHPRCYPGKATERFFISANRGIEFIDLFGKDHAQNDWARGPCTFGILPCNGLVYSPPNPCFCFTGVKVTGFNAFTGADVKADMDRAEPDRLEKFPAHEKPASPGSTPPGLARSATPDDCWPTYRHDGRRTGGTTAKVTENLKPAWQVAIGGRLTQPVIAGGQVFVASKDTHTLHALDAATGRQVWHYTAGGRIDSPPTVFGSLVLFGCTDGSVYCLDAASGQPAWRFRAAPTDRRIVAFDQLESPWRVHGSVLVEDGIAYFTAGRSTNLDGGILVFGLDAQSGKLLHRTRLDTWSRTRTDAEGKPFIPGYHMEGACSDILTSEGGSIFLGQYKLDRSLKQQDVPYALIDPNNKSKAMGMEELMNEPYSQEVGTQKKDEVIQRNWQLSRWPKMAQEHREKYGASNLGERTMGRHVLATGGFLDDDWYNRTFWMYSQTWPGYHIANRAAKTGQLLSVDNKKTYAVQAFPRRNLQSPLFTPAGAGYLLLADDNDNEPVLPDYTRGVPKGIGFTRAKPPVWFSWLPVRIRAMVATADVLFVAGPPDVHDQDDPMSAFEGRKGAVLLALSCTDGKQLAKYELDAPPVFDGLSATTGRLCLATTDGKVICMAKAE